MRRRNIQSKIYLTDAENNNLKELLKITNMSKVNLINLLIRKELERLRGEKTC